MFLHPTDILALRKVCYQSTFDVFVVCKSYMYYKTCKALELVTRKRIVWVNSLHRVCHENTLFLPSFPIPDMSNLELERAAMAPRRWIELCGMFPEDQKKDSSEILHRRTSRSFEVVGQWHTFIVPGGKNLVTGGKGLSVWDLGYVSTVDCKLVASVGLKYDSEFLEVQATSDGKSLVILSFHK
jgi:hypothetical protein